MRNGKLKLAPYISAALLAALTIRVFSELQDYGPESAIRRFYGFAKSLKAPMTEGEFDELRSVTSGALLTRAELKMIARLREWDEEGASMQVLKMDRTGPEVRAAVVFTFPRGTPMVMVWVVVRTGNSWKVDANKTATILSDNFGF